mgnify:CR=1 FL=1
MIAEEIKQIFSEYPDIIYGFADISYSAYADKYQSALVFAIPYGEQLTLDSYSEEKFEKGIQAAKKIAEEVMARMEEMLYSHNIKYNVPPLAQTDEEGLEALFSFKYAAVNAGLGWIGKNDVVITEKYGPRVRLAAILIDRVFPYGRKITESKCPDSCKKCVEACPYQALHDVKWNIGTLRNDIIDYRLCNQKRSLYLERHGRKNACGLCMAACPVGMR